MMLAVRKLLVWMTCALVLLGALVACSPSPTPIAIPTSTIIPATETNTPSPVTPSQTPLAEATNLLSNNPTPDAFTPIIPLTITPDSSLSSKIIGDLAEVLAIPINRIQVVSIEERHFSANSLDCYATTGDSYGDPAPRETVFGYRYVLLVATTLYEYHSNGIEMFMRCAFEKPLSDELLIQLDPIAADTVRLVQNILAEELDISTRRIQLVSIIPVIWQDTSLGCPREGQTYNPAQLVGYRLLVIAGEVEYIYHSDSVSVYRCEAGNEVLP